MLAALAFFPSLSYADLRQFIPKPVSNEVIMELYGSYESEKTSLPGLNMESKDVFIKEKLTLRSIGFSYHPNFIQYQLALSVALKQEHFESPTFATSGWTNGSGFEYDAAVVILPTHPYNLKLFARRYEPVYESRSIISTHKVQYNRGAIFQYDKRPYLFTASYIENSSETSFGSADVRRFHASGLYHKEFKNQKMFALSAGYDQTNFSSSSSDNKGTARAYNLNNTVGLSWVNLNSNLNRSESDQERSLPGSVRVSTLAWNEALNVYLPLNFTVNANYLHQKNTFTSEATETSPESNSSTTQKQIGFEVRHVLYYSLRSSYYFLRNSFTSSGGEIVNTANSFQTNYKKMIPWGYFYTGLGLGRSVTDSSGQTAFANEPHVSEVPGSFLLNLEEPDRATIMVYMKSPVEPFELILLVENVHYVVTTFGNTFQINMLTVPPPFVVPGKYDFFVSYSLAFGRFKLQTDSFNYNASFSLFNDTVNPYYVFSKMNSKVLSGNMGGLANDSTSHTVGLILRKGPYTATAEYQSVNSTVTPYSRWLGELGWHSDIAENVTAHITGRYTNTNYSEGLSAVTGRAYTEKNATLVSSVAWRARVHLYLSASGSYSYRTTDLIKENSYSLGASFWWKVGKLILSLNSSIYSADSETTTSIRTKRLHQMYFIKIDRALL